MNSAFSTLPHVWSPELEVPVAPAIASDNFRVLRHLGAQSLRVSVVESATMSHRTGWSIDADGAVLDGPDGRQLDTVLPGGAASIRQGLAETSADETLSQKLSPRRWVFAWLLDASSAVVVEATFRERRDAVDPFDVLMLRLVCNSGMAGGAPVPMPRARAPGRRAWPQVERRANRTMSARRVRLTVLLLVASVALTAWLAAVGVPNARAAANAQRAELERSTRMAESTLTHTLSAAMATGDYGDVQSVLSSMATLGYFESAVVTNARERIVATSGSAIAAQGLRIGDGISPAFAASSRALALQLGSQPLGQVLLVAAPPATGSAALHGNGLLFAAVAAFTASIASAGYFAMQLRRSRH